MVVLPLGIVAAIAITRGVAGVQPESAATLDVIVVGRDGKAPASMTPADFTLKVGGRVQQIRSIEKVTPSDDKGRYVLLIIDEATLQTLEPIVKDAIARLLKSLSPKDQVEYFSTRQNGTHTEATTKRETITAAAEKMVTGPGVLWVCQRDLMELIASFARDLSRGRATSIAVLSRGTHLLQEAPPRHARRHATTCVGSTKRWGLRRSTSTSSPSAKALDRGDSTTSPRIPGELLRF